MLFAMLPIVALLAVIGLLALDDVRHVSDLNNYAARTVEVSELIELRSAVQEERHLLVDPSMNNADFESLDASFASPIEEALRMRSTIDVVQVLPEARRLRTGGELAEAVEAYTTIVHEFDRIIAEQLDRAPSGEADIKASSLIDLLASHEAFLQEDLELFAGDADPLTIVRHREAGLQALDRFSANASADGNLALDDLRSSAEWEELEGTIGNVFAVNMDAEATEVDELRDAATFRRVALAELSADEVARSQDFTTDLRNRELAQLGTLAAIIGAILTVAAIGTLLLRRSIVQPLSALTVQAKKLSRGEVTAIDDPARDEIAFVANAFSSMTGTVDHLFGDIDRITNAVHHGDHAERIDTEPLEGDWERLADTMNTTLATSAAHHEVTNEELERRMVVTDISGAAMDDEDIASLTSRVLSHLPKALSGSHAHIHQHPSGPPVIDLGVELEPSLSALEIPTSPDHAKQIRIGKAEGVASLIEFAEGPPAVLTLMFGDSEPTRIEPLISLVETSSQILSQVHRRQAAEMDATHNLEHDLTTGLANIAHLHRWFATTTTPVDGWMTVGVTPQLSELDGSSGREARDMALQSIGEVLDRLVSDMAAAQSIDARLVRVGDPEFVAVVPTDYGELLATAFASLFAEPISIEDAELSIDATIGLAEIDPEHNDLTEALTNLASAIRRGQHRMTEIVPFETRYRDDVRRRTHVVRWLETAIENRDLQIHFQPIVNADSIVTEGYECLIRGSLDGTPVSPAEFIPLAEESGLVSAIGEFVLQEACAALPFLPGNEPYVAINISPYELSDDDLIDRIDNVLTSSRVDRSRVVFEVTEGVETSADDAIRLEQLRDLGVKIAIDDFGSGHANLSYLSALPAQILKLDRTLVTPIVDDPGAASVVLKAIEMAHQLGMTVVGEGVETNEELDALRRMRCDRVQGWFTGRPAALDTFIEIAVDRPPGNITSTQNASERLAS